MKVVYVKPLKESVTEDDLKECFKDFGEIERVKKIKDYAFIHYVERPDALKVNIFITVLRRILCDLCLVHRLPVWKGYNKSSCFRLSKH